MAGRKPAHQGWPNTTAGMVGYNLSRLRRIQGKSVDELAAAAGVSRSAWYRFEAGRRSIPSEAIDRAAAALGVNVAELLRRIPKKRLEG